MQEVDRRRALKREMDSYLTQRRKVTGWSLMNEKKDQLHPMVQPYKQTEQKTEEAPKEGMQDEYEEESKKGFFGNLMDKLFGDDETDELAEEEASQSSAPSFAETKEDLKTVSTISLNVMKQMGGENIKTFKESSDYETFKNILRKHQLIK